MKHIKKLISVITIVCFCCTAMVTTSHAQDKMGKQKMKDCVMMKDGKMMMMKDGKTMMMDQDMTLKNGTMIMKDGNVKMKDGKTMMMKEGESMDMNGKMKMKMKEKM
ncbi:MAG: DUF6799 domain-containing protein [Chitinophagaceae bacterium]